MDETVIVAAQVERAVTGMLGEADKRVLKNIAKKLPFNLPLHVESAARQSESRPIRVAYLPKPNERDA
jgi:hypothetical protein